MSICKPVEIKCGTLLEHIDHPSGTVGPKLWEEMYTTPDSQCRDNAHYSFTIFKTLVQLEHLVVVIGCCELGKPFNISEWFSGDPIHSVW